MKKIKRSPTVDADRVEHWNAIQLLARRAAESLYPFAHAGKRSHQFVPFDGVPGRGRILSAEQTACLGVLAFTCLAIESRADHLIEEKLKDPTSTGYKAAIGRPPWDKWRLLPRLVDKQDINGKRPPAPHDSVKQILEFRDPIIHSDVAMLVSKSIPNSKETMRWFTAWIQAMVEMNRLMDRGPSDEAGALAWGVFEPDPA